MQKLSGTGHHKETDKNGKTNNRYVLLVHRSLRCRWRLLCNFQVSLVFRLLQNCYFAWIVLCGAQGGDIVRCDVSFALTPSHLRWRYLPGCEWSWGSDSISKTRCRWEEPRRETAAALTDMALIGPAPC